MVIPILLAFLLIALPLVIAAPSFTTVNWTGGGVLDIEEQSDDDAYSWVHTEGNGIMGTYSLTDSNDNPYSYGVDAVNTQLDASITNGYIEFGVDRQDSKDSMYGPADQSTYSFLGSTGTGSLTFQTRTNYADLDSSNYGFQSNDQFLASGTYEAYHNVTNGANSAYFWAGGVGTLDQDHMTDDTGNTKINFGAGCGCYTNADVTQTGGGFFEVGGHFENSLTNTDVSATGPVTYVERYDFSDGFTWDGYNFMGD